MITRPRGRGNNREEKTWGEGQAKMGVSKERGAETRGGEAAGERKGGGGERAGAAARGAGTLIPSAQRLAWAAKQPLGNAALGALFA